MKKHCALAIFLAVLVTLAAWPIMAEDNAELKNEIQAVLNQVAVEMVKKELAAVAAHSMPQAVFHFRDGKSLTLAQWQESRAKALADMQNISSKFVVEKAWPEGADKAGVTYQENHQFTTISDPGAKQAIEARFSAVLCKTDAGWRFLEFKELDLRVTRDGKLVEPPAEKK